MPPQDLGVGAAGPKNTKVVWYSEAMLLKTTLAHTLHSRSQEAAKVLGVIARLLGCAGQVSDAGSDYTQIKMEDAPTPRHKWPKSWHNIDSPVVPLERNL